ncbi:MAG: thioredoxin domain-containing protein [Phycisphaerae bacterium]|nr:thioredoxin domain-containing protein [Gemmatimonadaceae bacterium]
MSRADLGRYEGRATAPIWIVMVSDFQCPYCRDWHDSTLAQVRKAYVETGKARLAYLNLPLQGHRHAVAMAKAGLCAASQEKFWPYAEAMFNRQQTVANLGDVQPLLHSLAGDLKLDTAAFSHCTKSSAVTGLLNSDLRQANQANIRSTPSFFVGQFLLEGAVPFSSFSKAVDSALVVAAKSGPPR